MRKSSFQQDRNIEKNNHKNLDNEAIQIIQSLNWLILHAQRKKLVTVARILEDARESICWWAVSDDFKEDSQQKSVNDFSLNHGLIIALDLLAQYASITDSGLKAEILQNFAKYKAHKELMPA
jgi:hypothetical protein